jgi:monoamine oxidase
MDYVIIGGGIAGLYCAYKLQQRNPNQTIVLCEKDNRLGGRIHTYYGNGFSLEAGAGRFNRNHTILIHLIEELGLKNKMQIISSDFVYSDIHQNNLKPSLVSKLTILIGELVVYSKLYSTEQLQQMSLMDLAEKILKKEDIDHIKNSFGYYSELVIMNAKDALQLIVENLNPMLEFYMLEGGLSQIIEEIKKRLRIKIITNIEITKIKYEKDRFELYSNHKMIQCKTCICAIPTPELKKIKLFHTLDPLLKQIKCSPLCRIYSTFKEPWFSKLPKLSTNNQLRMIIPLSQGKVNTIMVSYTDNKFAKYWLQLYQKGKKEKVDEKIKQLTKQSTGLDVPKPINTYMFYWECGVGYWGIGADSHQTSKTLTKPFGELDFYVCGEHYSEKNQQWMEGALDTASNVLQHIL